MERRLLLMAMFYTAVAEHFRFPASNSCFLANMVADFRLYVDTESGYRGFSEFSFAGATVNNETSACKTPTTPPFLDIMISPFNDKLSLSLETDDHGNVSLRVYYRVKPVAHFPDYPGDYAPMLADTTHLPVGRTGKSYKCASPQTIWFEANELDDMYMTMEIRDVHIQAFNVTNSRFSPAVVCPQDVVTTTAHTTASETTAPETTAFETTASETTPFETTTSETTPFETTASETTPPETTASETTPPETTAPQTTPPETTAPETTQPETTETETTPTQTTSEQTTVPVTTPSSRPARNLYVVKQDNVTCLVVEAAIVIDIQYESRDGTKTLPLNVPKGAGRTATGVCNRDVKENVLAIHLFAGAWGLNITVGKDTSQYRTSDVTSQGDVSYSWKSIDLEYIQDKEHFPDAMHTSDTPKRLHVDLANNTFHATTVTSYKCNAQTEVMLKGGTKLQVSELQYRAFGNTNNDSISNKGVVECSKDKVPAKKNYTLVLGIIFGCIVVGLCLIILVAYISLVVRKKRNHYHAMYEPDVTFDESYADSQRRLRYEQGS